MCQKCQSQKLKTIDLLEDPGLHTKKYSGKEVTGFMCPMTQSLVNIVRYICIP
jgi:hypothetical protein